MIKTGDDLRAARHALGLSVNDLARALRLGKRGNEFIRRMEADVVNVTGPVAVAVEAMMKDAGLEEVE